MYQDATVKCDYCLRRPRSVGGNGTCPVFSHPKVCTGATRSGQPTYEKVSDEDAWTNHRRVWPVGCPQFRPGDRRVPAASVEQDGLF